jgi:uncharacterized tellurite resistance protein B-like protein
MNGYPERRRLLFVLNVKARIGIKIKGGKRKMSFSVEPENLDWLKENANKYHLKVSTFLNQVIRQARGETSVLSHNPAFVELKEKIEHMIVNADKIRGNKRNAFLERVYKTDRESWGRDTYRFWANTIAKEQYGIQDMTVEEIMEYSKQKDAERTQQKIKNGDS